MIQILVNDNPWLMYLIIAVLALIIGSFLNVVIYRVPLMLMEEHKQQCSELFSIKLEPQYSINLLVPRSFCPNCKNMIRAWQNIPLLSYMLLKGQCYQCKSHVPIRYPLIELFTLILFLYASWHFGFTVELPCIFIAISYLICLTFIDLEHQLLPDVLTLSFLWTGLLVNTQNLFTPLSIAVWSAAGAYIALWLFIKLFYLITKKTGMGHGDFKLFAGFGAWFGWKFLPLILLVASLSGAIAGIIYLRSRSTSLDNPIPFGPFLCMSALAFLFWGDKIIKWYLIFLNQ